MGISFNHKRGQKLRRTVLFPVILLLLGLIAIPYTYASSVELSPREQQWLSTHKKIRISGPQAFPPFQYIDEDGAFKGMATDYLNLIAKQIGLEIEVVKDLTWPQILERIKNKEIDVLSCAATTKEREEYLSYSTPHLSFPLVIISKKDAPFFSGINSLHKRKIVFVKKNASYDWLQQENIDFEPLFVDSPLEALKEVSLGQADAAIENLAAASYLIDRHGLTNLKVAAPTSFNDYSLSIAVRNDWPELLSIFNKALATIGQDQHNRIRQRWISVRYEHGINMDAILKWGIIIGSIVISLFLLFYFWNRKLTQEISERKKAELEKEKLITELTSALDEIKTLRGILPICSECKKIRDDSGYWTQIESYMSKHLDADFSHGLCPGCITKLYGSEEWFDEAIHAPIEKSL